MSERRARLRAITCVTSFALLAAAITACGERHNTGSAPILLFTGTGTSPGDVAALETILDANHLDYATASSAALNALAEADIRRYRLLMSATAGSFSPACILRLPRVGGAV